MESSLRHGGGERLSVYSARKHFAGLSLAVERDGALSLR